jgi:hypothetical protein
LVSEKKMSKFDIKDRVDSFIYSAYNVLSEIIFGLDVKSKKLVRRNTVFKNVHAGERCFILGTGPSLCTLTEDEIEKLRSEVVFGVNSLYKSNVVRDIVPKYYTLIDNLYWDDGSPIGEGLSYTFADVAGKYSANPPIFITDPRARDVVGRLDLKKPTIYIYSKKYPTKEMSSEISENIYAAMNCITYSVLTAIYMGFKEIYIMGCDYNAFCSAGSGHCYDDKEDYKSDKYNLAFYLKFYWITTEFHYLVAKLADDVGVAVVNLTPGSLLDAYPRRSLSDVL